MSDKSRQEALERYIRCMERLCLDLYRGGKPHAEALAALADIGRSVELNREARNA